MSLPTDLALQILKKNMFLLYRPRQMSHRRDFNSFFSENGAKMIIPTNRDSYCNRRIRQNNCNMIFYFIYLLYLLTYPAALIGTDYFVAYQLNTIVKNCSKLEEIKNL